MLSINQAKDYFEEVNATSWKCKQTGITLDGAILTYYQTCTNVDLSGLSLYGLPIAPVEKVANTKQATLQRLERGVIVCDPANELDRVPGISGPCYPAHIDKGPGQDPRITQSKLTQELQTAQQAASNGLPKQWHDVLMQLKPLLDALS